MSDPRDFYSEAEREHLHPAGLDMNFGDGRYFMRPEAADRLAYNLVQIDRPTGSYRRQQPTPVDERLIISEALARQKAEAAMADKDRPAPSSRIRR